MSKSKDSIFWHISVLSAIAGPMETMLEDDTGFAWSVSGYESEYWLRLFKRDDGNFFIHMDDRYGDRIKIMAVAGYIQHCGNGITYNISSWDELMDEAEDQGPGVRH